MRAYAVGDQKGLVVVDGLTRSQIAQYAGASGDFHPMQTDEVFAKEVAEQPSVLAHGMLVMAAAGTLLRTWFGPAEVKAFQCSFRRPVLPGDTLTTTGTITDLIGHDGGTTVVTSLITRNQEGEVVLVGEARVFRQR